MNEKKSKQLRRLIKSIIPPGLEDHPDYNKLVKHLTKKLSKELEQGRKQRDA